MAGTHVGGEGEGPGRHRIPWSLHHSERQRESVTPLDRPRSMESPGILPVMGRGGGRRTRPSHLTVP